jgi:hypothetical protein
MCPARLTVHRSGRESTPVPSELFSANNWGQ